ncbi:LysE family translocator [Aquimarina agarivorans]|uniref:LysE family translocator n=1 Tax=Aquimarina agarivorans TaxID=980584 RepID=UPI000248F2C0|nr:LysE family transporter [Aquimarina agarivorans]
MYLEDLREAILIGLFLAILLGPAFFALLETAAIKGFRAAISFDFGVIFADIVFIAIAYLSTNKLLEKIKDDPSLFIFGGVLLTAYGTISLIKGKKSFNQQRNIEVELINKHNYFKLFLKGFLLNFINIGVLGFWLTIIITIGPQLDMDHNRIIFFFSTVLFVYLLADILKILLAKTLKKKLTPTRIYNLKKIVSILMIIFGGVLLSKGLFPSSAKMIQKRIQKVKPY